MGIARHTLNRHQFIQTLQNLSAGFRHAFTLTRTEPLALEDVVLLEHVADCVVARRMGPPAVLFLESLGPMHFLGSQALHFLSPILDVILPQPDVQRLAHLLERRDTLSRLVLLIENRLEASARRGS